MNEKDLADLRQFIISDIKRLLENSVDIHEFYSSAIESYLVCLQLFLQLSLLRKEEIDEVKLIIKKISNKV
jgi:hypothetical protein